MNSKIEKKVPGEIERYLKWTLLSAAAGLLAGALLTHLFGGAAGREGTAVQMAASLSDQLSRFFKIEINERKILLVAGTGAGFGAVIGAGGLSFELLFFRKNRGL